MSLSDLATRKAELRRMMRGTRSSIPEAERVAMGERIADVVMTTLAGFERVMIFLSFGSEVATDPLVGRLAAAGHPLCVPHIEGGALVPVAHAPGDPVVPGVRGIREPAVRVPVEVRDIDAIVVPGLAFDTHGYRIGYGGGYYDKLLDEVRADALAVGICFHQQIVEEVPHGGGDRPVHLVITDREAIDCGR